MNYDLLYKLLKTPSPSGYELNIQKLVIEEMKGISDKVYTQDNLNVINAINPQSQVKVLLSGHIDEISLVIEKINADGTCKVTRNGGTNPYAYATHHVNVVTKKGLVPGVFGYVANMKKGGLEEGNLVLDLGTYSKEETEKLVNVGDPVIHSSDYRLLNENILSARALDDRLGAFICLEVLKRVKERGTKNGVYASTTVGEETTGRGAMSAANLINPTCALIVDVTYANDVNHLEHCIGEVALNKGPVLTIGSLMNKVMHEKMIELSEKLGIGVQYDINTSRTYTDTDNIFSRFNGIPCYLISIPLRYMHSSVEVCDLRDVEKIIQLFTEFILELNEETSFNPFNNDLL